jgi:hypothetical protein
MSGTGTERKQDTRTGDPNLDAFQRLSGKENAKLYHQKDGRTESFVSEMQNR